VEFVVSKIFGEGLFGGAADAMVFDTSVEEQNFRGDAPDPAEAIEELIGATAFDAGLGCQTGAGEVLVSGSAGVGGGAASGGGE
jgi:hypothetical protein